MCCMEISCIINMLIFPSQHLQCNSTQNLGETIQNTKMHKNGEEKPEERRKAQSQITAEE